MSDDQGRIKAGQTLLLAGFALAEGPRKLLESMGFSVLMIDDPYAALVELLDRPLVYRAMIVSLQSLMPEELAVIGTARRSLPHLDVWLTHTDGRPAALAACMRYGAAGFLTEEGLIRVSDGVPPMPPAAQASTYEPHAAEELRSTEADAEHHDAPSSSYMEDLAEDEEGQPILSADELRALLAEPPGSLGEA